MISIKQEEDQERAVWLCVGAAKREGRGSGICVEIERRRRATS
jgi:hypothetical protein